METPANDKFENENKMADSRFAISNQSDVGQLKENFRNPNILKATLHRPGRKLGRIGRQN